MRTVVAVALTVAAAAPVHAAKVPADFRAAFERTFKPGRTFAVVMQDGLPTTSVYGINGDQTAAHFSIDVVEGAWKASGGLLDTDQTAADLLSRGEVMEIASMSWKDDRVDLRMVSVEAHKVTRGEWILKQSKREPVATNFKFFFPFAVRGAEDVDRAVDYVRQYLHDFPTEADARTFAARVIQEGGAPGGKSPAVARAGGGGAGEKKEIKAGMTPLEVIDVLGKPDKEVSFENRSRWTYPDLTVIFENGRVKEVKF